ncbi:MAG: phytase [Lysobacter sp.]|nr:phytase [Lysobacter sp.]
MRMSYFRPLAALALLFVITACAAQAPRDRAAPRPVPKLVTEAYVSPEAPNEEFDSLATWRHPDGTTWLIATAKSSHRLVIFDADTGTRLREIGSKGPEPGQFIRPNGIAVLGDRLFVAERDNHRVQGFSLPEFRPLGSFGQAELRSPYGLWLNPVDKDTIDVYVTDNFMEGPRYEVVPPLEQLDQRVRRYRLRFDTTGALAAKTLGSFGDTGEATALRIVESLAGDARRRTLLIADEDTRRESTLREYRQNGRSTGRSVPRSSFEAEAEGVALWACGRERGYWIAVDQLQTLTVFRLFDRASLAARGSFTGATVAATDGISLRTAPSHRFPKGALFAVHRDKSVAAFDLRDIVAMLKLDRSCL